MSIAFLLDTDALSEPLKPQPNVRFMTWLKDHSDELATAAPVWHEMAYGCCRLPSRSTKRRLIEAYLHEVVRATILVLPYDLDAAAWHGKERARLTRKGKPPAFVDGQIAAIARVNGLTVITGNVRHYAAFEGLKAVDWRST